jgi:hypothetical protein
MNRAFWRRLRPNRGSIPWIVFAAGVSLLVAADRIARILAETYVLAFHVSPMEQNLIRLHGQVAGGIGWFSLLLLLAAVGLRYHFVFNSKE